MNRRIFPTPPKKNQDSAYSYYVFLKSIPNSTGIFYARYFSVLTRDLIATRSLGKGIENFDQAWEAGITSISYKVLEELEIEVFKNKRKISTEKNIIKSQSFAEYVANFWNKDISKYLISKEIDGEPISTEYIKTRMYYVNKYILKYKHFITPLKWMSPEILDEFKLHLQKDLKLELNKIASIIRSIQRPISWAREKEYFTKSFIWKAGNKPKQKYSERGVFSPEQVRDILNLPTHLLEVERVGKKILIRNIRSRKNSSEFKYSICIRVKTAIALSIMTGLRRGEILGLTWNNVDFKNRHIIVINNYVRYDKNKKPKANSVGKVPLTDKLILILRELEQVSKRLGIYNPNGYLIFSSNPERPFDCAKLQEGFIEAMEMIGINNSIRKEKKLVFHSGRHFLASYLERTIGRSRAKVITRHKSSKAFDIYGYGELGDEQDLARNSLDIIENNKSNSTSDFYLPKF